VIKDAIASLIESFPARKSYSWGKARYSLQLNIWPVLFSSEEIVMGRLVEPLSPEEWEKLPSWQKWLNSRPAVLIAGWAS